MQIDKMVSVPHIICTENNIQKNQQRQQLFTVEMTIVFTQCSMSKNKDKMYQRNGTWCSIISVFWSIETTPSKYSHEVHESLRDSYNHPRWVESSMMEPSTQKMVKYGKAVSSDI